MRERESKREKLAGDLHWHLAQNNLQLDSHATDSEGDCASDVKIYYSIPDEY
jgi:hypothetical protein